MSHWRRRTNSPTPAKQRRSGRSSGGWLCSTGVSPEASCTPTSVLSGHLGVACISFPPPPGPQCITRNTPPFLLPKSTKCAVLSERGGLAAHLPNAFPKVYLDLSLVVPMLSVQGMREAVRQCLHLCPIAKLLFSTDAYAFPERYYATAKWGRQVLAQELALAQADGDLTEGEALQAARRILHDNAQLLYPGLGSSSLEPSFSPPLSPVLANGSLDSFTPVSPTREPPALPGGVEFVHLLWCDAAGLRRTRLVPAAGYPRVVQGGLGLTQGCMALPRYGDVCAPMSASGLGPVGEVRLTPDPATLRVCPWRPSHALALADLRAASGGDWECNPRGALARALALAEERHGLGFRVGFESEFMLLRPTTAGEGSGLEPVDGTSYCASQAWVQSGAVLDEMVKAVQAMGLTVEQCHAESAPGQFEIVTSVCDSAAEGALGAAGVLGSCAWPLGG